VQPGIDQAFIFGLGAILHKLNGEDGYFGSILRRILEN